MQNKDGPFEDAYLFQLHSSLLDRLDRLPASENEPYWEQDIKLAIDYLRPLLSRSSVVVKDPRAVHFIGFYNKVASRLDCELKIVVMLREPSHFLRSCDHHYDRDLKEYAIWYLSRWSASVLAYTSPEYHRRCFLIEYSQIFENTKQLESQLSEFLGVKLEFEPAKGELEAISADKFHNPLLKFLFENFGISFAGAHEDARAIASFINATQLKMERKKKFGKKSVVTMLKSVQNERPVARDDLFDSLKLPSSVIDSISRLNSSGSAGTSIPSLAYFERRLREQRLIKYLPEAFMPMAIKYGYLLFLAKKLK